MITLLVILLILLLILGVPAWHVRGDYGWGPPGVVGLLVLIILVVLLLRLGGVWV